MKISNKKSNDDLSFESEKNLVETNFSVKLLGEKSEELRCPYCDKIQTNKSSLSYHISTVHYFQNPFLKENTNLSIKKKQIESKGEDNPKQICWKKSLDSKTAQKEHLQINKTDQEMIEGGPSKGQKISEEISLSPSKGQEISEENSLTGWSTPGTTQSSPNGSLNKKSSISEYVSSQNCMNLRIILLHDSCKNCRRSISARDIKELLELISAPTILPRSI